LEKRKEKKVKILAVLVVIAGAISILCGFVLYATAEEPKDGMIGYVLILIGIFLILILGDHLNSLA
jgi:uncharacterized membrane protein HdeD (DUF308 family)